MKCLLCGYEFEGEGSETCQECIFTKKCKMACCPNCGYKIPLKTKILSYLKKEEIVRK